MSCTAASPVAQAAAAHCNGGPVRKGAARLQAACPLLKQFRKGQCHHATAAACAAPAASRRGQPATAVLTQLLRWLASRQHDPPGKPHTYEEPCPRTWRGAGRGHLVWAPTQHCWQRLLSRSSGGGGSGSSSTWQQPRGIYYSRQQGGARLQLFLQLPPRRRLLLAAGLGAQVGQELGPQLRRPAHRGAAAGGMVQCSRLTL